MSNPVWELPTPSHTLECIERWRQLDLRNATDDEIEREFVQLRDQMGRIIVQRRQSSHVALWRVRRDGQRFPVLRDFLSPPAEVTQQGRCNVAGKPMLYCARNATTAIDEMDVSVSDRIVLVNYECKGLSLSKVVGDFDPNPQNGDRILDGDHLCSYQIVREFLYSEFTKPVGTGTEFLYRVSAAVCRTWTSDGTDGWLYPSVRSYQGENVALKPSVEETKLTIKQAYLAEITDLGYAERVHRPGIALRQIAIAKVAGERVTWLDKAGRIDFIRNR